MKPLAKVGLAVAGVAGVLGIGYGVYKYRENAALFAQYRKHGDINGDGLIDGKDLALLQAAFGTTPGSPNWNPHCDLNGDGYVGIEDLYICAENQGLTFQQWLKTKGYARRNARSCTVQTGIVPIKEI